MMNYEEVKAMVKVLAKNNDAFAKYEENCICVTLIDCDESWEECDYNNEEAVDAFIEAGTCLTVMFFDALVVPEWITETVAVRLELDSLLVTVNVIVLSF